MFTPIHKLKNLAFYSCINSLTIGDSGWSSRSSKSSPMMSESKSWLVWGMGQGLLALHPLTNVGTGRAAEVGADTGRGTDSKPGGSDGVTEGVLLLGESSSTTVSFRGGWTATGTWTGAGTGAMMLPSCVSRGTSEPQRKRQDQYPDLVMINLKLRQVLNLPISISSTEDEPWENWMNAEEM